MLPWGIFALVVMAVCFTFAGLILNGRLGPLASLLVAFSLLAVYFMSNKSMDRINETWGDGARGEFAVGKELERLHNEGFYVFHDWDSGRGNVDHFAVGTRGVFVVETKALRDEVTCEDGKLLQNGRPIPGKDIVKQTMAEAMAVKGSFEARPESRHSCTPSCASVGLLCPATGPWAT